MPQNGHLPPPAPTRATTDALPKILTRSSVARLLRCSISYVRALERRGKLKPIVDSQGIRRFNRSEVEAIGRERLLNGFRTGGVTGELAAEVFRYFRDSVSFAEIVIRTRTSPETIRLLWDEYKRPLGCPPADSQSSSNDVTDCDRRARELDNEILERRRRRQQGGP